MLTWGFFHFRCQRKSFQSHMLWLCVLMLLVPCNILACSWDFFFNFPRRQLMIYVIIGQLQAAPCMCFCFEVAMENRLIPRWRHTTHPGFFWSLKKLSTKIYTKPKWAYYQDHLSDDPFVPLAPSMMELMGKASSQQSSEKAWVCCVLVSFHRWFNRVSIATRQNLTGENNNKHAAAQWNAYGRQPMCHAYICSHWK